MGYDLHITRAEEWSDNAEHRIEEAEWMGVVEGDSQLEVDAKNPGFVLWRGESTLVEPWLQWVDGNIETKNPDKALVVKMLDVARQLKARVQGDDGEFYEDAGAFPG